MHLKKNQQNYWSFYLSEPFENGHFNVKHPVDKHDKINSINEKKDLIRGNFGEGHEIFKWNITNNTIAICYICNIILQM